MKLNIDNTKSKKFKEWAASYFTPEELKNLALVESHFHAWCGARNRASEILDQYHNVPEIKNISEKINSL